jgi:very-short-patch-repair endonuclease
LREQVIQNYYLVDMYIPKHKLIIEVHGPHHLDGRGQIRAKDRTKSRVCVKLGYKYCHINARLYLSLNNLKCRAERVN